MEFSTNDVFNASQALADANNYPFIRVTSGPLQGKLDLHTIGPTPYANRVAVDLPWSIATNETIGGVGGSGGWDYFSAVCWFTLKGVADANKAAGQVIPLGGIVECYGGTSIQWWSSPQALAKCDLASNPGSACCNYGGNASCLFNAQVAPYTIGPTRVSSFAWYQGEQNAGCGGPPQIPYYECALPALIADWRALFDSPNAPFGVFLLAAWSATTDSFPLIRLVQVEVSHSVPNTYVSSTLDQGTPGGPVHSIYKQIPGFRASLAISNLVYGRSVEYKGPAAITAVAPSSPISADATAAVQFSLPLVLSAPAPTCPLAAAACEGFAVQLAPACTWVTSAPGPLVVSLGTDAMSLQLTLPAAARAGGNIVAVRGYFGNWPLVNVYGETGLPIEPFLLNATTSGNPCSPPTSGDEWDASVHA